jgi:imidazolonepropionase-like amidohydrolase
LSTVSIKALIIKKTVAALCDAGTPIFAGSDACLLEDSPTPIEFGISLHKKLEYLFETGLSNLEALQAAATHPPKYFDLKDRGTVEPDMRADLILLRNNLLKNIRTTRDIERL